MIGLEKPPGVRNSPAKAPCFPRFSHLYSQSLLLLFSPLLLHHASSPLSLASSFSPSPSFPPSLPPCLPLSVLLCLLSSCIAPPAPWCSTDNQNSAHIHARTEAHERTHTYGRTHTGRHTPTTSGSPPSLSHTSPLQTRNILQPLVCQRFIKRRCQHYIKTVFCIHTQCGLLFTPLKLRERVNDRNEKITMMKMIRDNDSNHHKHVIVLQVLYIKYRIYY